MRRASYPSPGVVLLFVVAIAVDSPGRVGHGARVGVGSIDCLGRLLLLGR